MATNNLLENPAPAHHKFVDNQVLTDDQLNAVLDHLNYQDQLSRVLLSGVGIVCGLKVSLTADGKGVRLNKGAAVTTAGNLLKAGNTDTLYKGFKLFKDENVKYERFLADESTTMPLWELETDTEPSDVHSLENFEDEAGFSLEKAVAVLYLEDYLKEEEDCSPVDCNAQGREVINRIRLLLVSPDHAKSMAEKDSIYSGLLSVDKESIADSLPHMFAKRVVLTPANTNSYDQFKKAYATGFKELADRITQLSSLSLLSKLSDQTKVDPAKDLDGFVASFMNIQYLYDFYKDLVTAYNELRQVLLKNYALCCPDPEAFPKHVMLGTLTENGSNWRHRFYPSPILNYGGIADIQHYFIRLLLMIKNFKTGSKREIVITPSKKDDALLGEQAIPFYYNLEAEKEAEPFYHNWKEESTVLSPNYYGYNYPNGSFDPLEVCLPGHDFYRIEGHLGHHVLDAHKRIQEIKEEKGLAFDIMPIAIGNGPDEETIDYDRYRVYFEDLQVVLQAWNEEQQCLMRSTSSFLSRFSLKEAGRHISYIAKDGDSNTSSASLRLTRREAQPQFLKKKFTEPKKNYVLEGIEDEKDTLGFELLKRIDASDNKNDILVKTRNGISEIIKDWDAEIVEAVINTPLDLLGHLKETEDNKLTDIEEFTEENLEKYIASLEAQCKKTNSSKKKLQSLSRKEGSTLREQPWMEHYEFTLNRVITSCCLIEKVKVLYEKILERKREVLEQLVLHNFIEQHSGAEHKAGASRGGTFVMLYFSTKQESDDSTRRVERIGRAELIQPENIRFLTSAGALSRFPGFERIPHGTVIGDLCLPYICCSSTPATTFVFPEQLATLRLPVDHVCITAGEQADTIPLQVMPADAKINAFIQKCELTGVIVVNQSGSFFNPDKVASNDYGKPIRFEVNGQEVEPILKLYRKPKPGFTYSEQVAFRNNNTIAVVTFENTSEPFEELTFEWDFGTGTVERRDALKFTHSFDVQPGQNFDFKVTLTAFNGPCRESFSDSVNIDVPDLEEPEENCQETTVAIFKAALRSFENDERIIDRAPNQVKAIYENVIQIYRAILRSPEEALKGDMDRQIFSAIQKMQFQAAETLPGVDGRAHREFLLKVYYELMLLYFYVQACRDTEIDINSQISDVVGSWPDFTRNAVRQFKEALSGLLKVNKVHTKLEAILKQMQERMIEELQKIIQKIIKDLNNFIEQ